MLSWTFAVKGILMLVVLALIIYVFIFKVLIPVIHDFKSKNFRKAAIRILCVAGIVLGLRVGLYGFSGANLPVEIRCSKEYIQDINKVEKTRSGTRVKLNKALMDFNNLNFNLGVWGKDKLVAIEVKKDLKDNEPLRAIQGLWVGDRLSYRYGGYGVSYKGDSFIDPIYIVCYFSNGEEVSFKLEDTKNIKDKVKKIELNQTVNSDSAPIRVKTFTKGINYSDLELASDVNFFDVEVSMEYGRNTYDKFPGSGSGGKYEYWLPPVGEGEAVVKIRVKSSGKEFSVKVQ